MAEKKHLLIGVGNFTLTLRGTYHTIIRDDFGRPIANETIPPLQLVFNNGVPVEVDDETLELVKKTRPWGNSISFHAASLPKEAPAEIQAVSKRVTKAIENKLEDRKNARMRAREGVVDPDSGESFE